MKNSTLKFLVGIMLFAATQLSERKLYAQDPGDFRSKNGTADHSWANTANWEIYDGVNWIPASYWPTSADGVITILSGTTITIYNDLIGIPLDQIVLNSTAILYNVAWENITLNDGPGVDLQIDAGSSFACTSATGLPGVKGTGEVVNDGLILYRNFELRTLLTNNGTINCVAVDGTPEATARFFISGAEGGLLINNGIFSIDPSTSITQCPVGGSGNGPDGTLINSSTGIIENNSAHTVLNLTLNTLTNEGAINSNATLSSGFTQDLLITCTNAVAGAGTINAIGGSILIQNDFSNSLNVLPGQLVSCGSRCSGASVINDGSIVGVTPFTFSGSTVQTFGGNGTIQRMKMDGTGGVNMTGEQTVLNTLEFVNGTITLNTFDLKLNNTSMSDGVVNETANAGSYIVTSGSGRFARNLASGDGVERIFPVGSSTGYLPAVLTLNPTTATNLLYVRVMSGVNANYNANDDPIGTFFCEEIVNHTWSISENTPDPGLDIDLKLQWTLSDESSLFDHNSCKMGWFDLSAPIPTWTVLSPFPLTAADNNPIFTVTQTGITQLCPFAVYGTLVTPGLEVCNGQDDDCNGFIDDGLTFTTYYVDADFDGSGDPSDLGTLYCSNPGSGYSLNNTDCSPNDGNKWQESSLYVDVDGDGYDAGTALVCYGATIPSGYSDISLGTDCADGNNLINPGATEFCGNGLDENCNGMADDVCVSVCPAPVNLTNVINAHSVNVSWDVVPGAQGYKVRYREVGASSWTRMPPTMNDYKRLFGLTPGISYEWEVKTVCTIAPTLASVWSEPQTFIAPRLSATAITEGSSIEIFPNPNNGDFTLNMDFGNEKSGSATLEILNSVGQRIYSDDVAINLGEITKRILLDKRNIDGQYIFRIITGEQVYTSHFILQR